jgi:hypothetical protein
MCQRTIRRVQDEEKQRIINEEVERRLLAAYIHGLKVVIGQQVQFQMPSTMEQAVRLAVTIENVERLRQMKEGPRKIFTTRPEIRCYQCGEIGHYTRDCRRDLGPALSGGRLWGDQCGKWVGGSDHESQATRGNRNSGGPSRQDSRRPMRPWVPSGDSLPSGIQCFHCQGFGHLRWDCPKMYRAFRHPYERGLALRSPVSNPPPMRK